MSYDPAGNVTYDNYTGAGTRTYDAENRIVSAQANATQTAFYTYDGNGQRVKRNTGSGEVWRVYGIGGELLAEYAAGASPASPQEEYGYRAGDLFVTATVTGGWGAAPLIHDNPLVPHQTTVQSRHIAELRAAIDALRSHTGLSAYFWQTDASVGALVKADPVLEMRTALDQALGAPSGGYSPGPAQGQPIQAVHIQELRDRVLNAWQGGTSGTDLRWLVTDQLGTPRMVIDKTGSLSGVKRHDYFPFGEEIGADNSWRTSAHGYGAGDGVRQKFTGHERDNETGLDYVQARYYGSAPGRFTSVDPYNPVVDIDKEEAFKEYLGQPQNWNRYAYVWNNPLKYTDPFGEKVYVVTYTYGNSEGDDELRRSAETKANHIQNMKGFDPKKDTVLLKPVKTKEDFANVIKEANGLEKKYGKVEQVTLYSHAGKEEGPVFHDGVDGGPTQFTKSELAHLKVNWSSTAIAKFYGCYTGLHFAQDFADAQGVPSYGYDRYAYFSSRVDSHEGPDDTGPVYLIAADGWSNGGYIKHVFGYGKVYPMVRRDPPPQNRPRM